MGAKAEAESVLRRGRRAHPGDVWLNYDLARALEKLARREEAIRYYTAARMLRPETAHELAHALGKKGESEEAIGVFHDLARMRPGNGRHLGCLGHALLDPWTSRRRTPDADRGRRRAAPDHRRPARRLLCSPPAGECAPIPSTAWTRPSRCTARRPGSSPNTPIRWTASGWILLGRGRYDEAAAIYRDSLRVAPDNTVALEGLGSALQELGRVDEAIELYRRALRIAPEDTSLHFKLGGALAVKGRLAEALAEKQEAARLTPDDSTVLHGLGSGLRDVGRFDETEAAFRKSIENQPDNPSPLNSLAWLLATAPDRCRRRPAEALELARRAVKEDPNTATNYNTLGVALYYNGLWDESIATLKKSIEMSKGTDPTDFFFLAMAYWRRGDRKEAERSFHRAVEGAKKDAPGLWEWRMIWAEAAELMGKPRPVPTLYEVKAEPDRAMAALQRMSEAGYLQLPTLQTDPDLAPIRDRPDFRRLLMDAVFPAEPFAH